MKIKSSEFVTSAVKPEQYPDTGLPEVAFVGRSNVGKSSLLNCLINRKKLALTSGTPGKTRLVNFFIINDAFYFVDLPGYGFARVSQETKSSWGQFVESYLQDREPLKLIVFLVDVRHPPSADDLVMYRWLIHFNLPTVIVATKADKISRMHRPKHMKQIRDSLGLGVEGPIILFSVTTGEGKDELWQRINQYLKSS
ncbi:MAG: YihA family ribosome biogenesis GTP-binding protein [Clostridiales bacterium]|jgi:GTP-binding protein|nr:YihA family ribosome biogenesis GTP-binding protein [Clostridiales bacterium]